MVTIILSHLTAYDSEKSDGNEDKKKKKKGL